MGVRALLQRGRTAPGLMLEAADLAQLNQLQDKTTLAKWIGGDFAAGMEGNLKKEAADSGKATLKGGPVPAASTPASPPAPTPASDPGLDDLTLIDHVGESLQEKLRESGLSTYESIAKMKARTLAESVSGVGDDSAKDIIKSAKSLAKTKAAGKL